MAITHDLVTVAAGVGNSTGTFTPATNGFAGAKRVGFIVNITAIGGTPTITYKFQGSPDGGLTWYDLATVKPDATVASSNAAITATTVSQEVRYVDGLDKRFFDGYRINVSANTNVTFNAKLIRDDH